MQFRRELGRSVGTLLFVAVLCFSVALELFEWRFGTHRRLYLAFFGLVGVSYLVTFAVLTRWRVR